MKAKRVLAAVLCAAMIFSSEGFSMGVLASELPTPTSTPMAVTEEKENLPDATQEPEEKETPDATQGPEENKTPDATREPVETGTPESDSPTPDVTQEPEKTPEVTPDTGLSPSPSQTPSALPDGTMSPDVSPTPSGLPEESGSPTPSMTPGLEGLEMEDELKMLRATSKDVLTVSDEGVLGIVEGTTSFPGTLIIPDEVKTIPDRLFKNTDIKNIQFGSDSELTDIGAGAFEGCSSLTEIAIPAGVTEIKADTFKNSGLSSISFKGSQVEAIGEEAFMNTGISNFKAPSSLKTIGESAFASCLQLSNLTMTNLETIGPRAFQNCKRLRDGGIGWSSKLTVIGSYAFQGCGFSNLSMAEVNEAGINEVVIGDGAFAYCADMTAIKLPSNLKNISNKMFLGCTALTKVTMPEETEVIEGNAFEGCTALEEIEIPANVMVIKSKAFSSCSSLKEIIINQKNTTSDSFVIAEDAFPSKTGVTMWGYDGKVQEYAEKMGYKFETLSERYRIYMSSEFAKYASMTVNKNPATQGTEVTITITPKSGYCLKEGTVKVKGKQEAEASLVSCTESKQIFSFLMPEGMPESSTGEKRVVIDAEFLEVKEAGSGELGYRLDKVNNQPIDKEDYDRNEFTMNKTGSQAQLVVYGTQTIGAWLLSYKSSNTSVATISNTGIICAKGKGTATITATLRKDTTKKISFKIIVTEDAVIDSLELELGKPSRATLKEIEVEEEGETKTYPVVEFNKATLAAGSQSFKVSFKAKEADGGATNLIVNSTWTTVDKNIAAVAGSKSSDNSNTITVKKGVEGETTITVAVTNKDKTVCKESFIVRVVDATPRLADSKVSVNKLSETGTAIDIVPVYGYDINHEVELQLCQKKVSGSMISYPSYNKLRVEYDESEGVYRIVANEELELAAGKTLSFKGSKQLYIEGEFKEGGTFRVPISEVTVVNKSLNPTVKLTGKINLFYNSTASPEEQGSVKLTQSLKNETVTEYKLVSAANHKKAGSEEEDTFAANFDIEVDADGNGIITRSDRETMAQVGGKNVVSGYVYIYYEGYNEPIKKSIKISTDNTSPSYVLSTTSATASVNKKDQTYKLRLLDKKTKKAIDLDNLAAGDGLTFDYSNTGTTKELFKDLTVEEDEDGKYIALSVDGRPEKGKAVINVKMATWSKPLKYTFNLKVTTSLPTVKLSASTVTLNSLCKSQEAVITTSLNQREAQLTGFEETSLTYTGNKKYKEEAEKLIISLNDDTITAALPQNETVKAGTYSFKVRPKVNYGEDSKELQLNYVTFKVKVIGNVPTVKLKSSTLSLNAMYPGDEVISTTYTISNLPAGSSYTIDSSAAYLSAVSTKNLAAVNRASDIKIAFSENNVLSVTLDENGYYSKSFNYDYYVNGLKMKINGESEVIELKPFKVKIKGNVVKPSIKVTAKGTLNPVDETSRIVYTAKVSNIVSDISSISIQELNLTDGRNDYYYADDDVKHENPISKNFDLEWEEGTNVIKLKAKDGITLKSGASYKIQFVFKLDKVSGKQYVTNDITIKPKQTLPKIKTNKKSAYLYAGQNREKEIEVKIEKTSLKGAEIEKVVFAKNTSDTIKKAYRIVGYDDDTGIMTLKLVNPSRLVLNKKHTITFETKCKNQMENSTGTTFKLDVTVRK